MGKIDLPIAQVTTEAAKPVTPVQPGGFMVDKDKLLSFSSESTPLPTTPTEGALELITMKRFLGLDPMDEDYNADIKGILSWGKEQNLKESELFEKVKEIKYKLGASSDKSVAQQVYQWMRLDGQIKSLVQKQRMVEHAHA